MDVAVRSDRTEPQKALQIIFSKSFWGSKGDFFKNPPWSPKALLHPNLNTLANIGAGGAEKEIEVAGLDDPLHTLIEQFEGVEG